MKLTPCSTWIKNTFENGVGEKTVTKWIEEEIIFGTILGTDIFVDADRTGTLMDIKKRIRSGDASRIHQSDIDATTLHQVGEPISDNVLKLVKEINQ